MIDNLADYFRKNISQLHLFKMKNLIHNDWSKKSLIKLENIDYGAILGTRNDVFSQVCKFHFYCDMCCLWLQPYTLNSWSCAVQKTSCQIIVYQTFSRNVVSWFISFYYSEIFLKKYVILKKFRTAWTIWYVSQGGLKK